MQVNFVTSPSSILAHHQIIKKFSVFYVQYVVNGVVACLVASVIILFSTYQASIRSCVSSILFICLSYPTSTKANGYHRELYYFSLLYCHSDSENVCMFEIRFDIRALISCINVIYTTFLQNLFVIVHMEISFRFKATIKLMRYRSFQF